MTTEKPSAANDPPSRPRHFLVRLVVGLFAAGAVLLIVLTFCSFFARYSWRCEQLCHFSVQYFWLLLVATIVMSLARWWRLALVAGATAALHLTFIAPIYWPTGQPPPAGQRVRIISYNVLSANRQHDDVLAMLRAENADVILLIEVNPAWAASLDELSDAYPYQHIVPRDDNFGISIFSRLPFRDVQTREFGPAGVPTVVATFELSEQEVTFVGTHPLPPGSARMSAYRNEQLSDVAEFVRQQSGPTILAGDLNVTEFSPYFTDLLTATMLRDSRQGFGVQASWAPCLPILEIPIDHCLVSDGIAVTRRRVGPRLGSDHRPVIVDLTVGDGAHGND